MAEKYLGKISSIKFGIGGYQDAMFGLQVYFEFDSSGIGDFKGTWDPETIECESKYCKWTEDDRDKSFVELCRFISKLLKDAKVADIQKLKGKPVEVTLENNGLKSWRILTEVL